MPRLPAALIQFSIASPAEVISHRLSLLSARSGAWMVVPVAFLRGRSARTSLDMGLKRTREGQSRRAVEHLRTPTEAYPQAQVALDPIEGVEVRDEELAAVTRAGQMQELPIAVSVFPNWL